MTTEQATSEIGCSCTIEDLLETLDRNGCTRCEDGRRRVRGRITSFMGAGQDLIIHPDAEAHLELEKGHCEWRKIQPLLREAGVGLFVNVIC